MGAWFWFVTCSAKKFYQPYHPPTRRVGKHRFVSTKSTDIGEMIGGRIGVLD